MSFICMSRRLNATNPQKKNSLLSDAVRKQEPTIGKSQSSQQSRVSRVRIFREKGKRAPSIYAIEPCMAPKLNFSSAPLSLCDYLIFTPIHKCLTFYKRDSAHIPNKNNTMQNIGSEFVRSFPLSVTPRSSDFLHVNTLPKI